MAIPPDREEVHEVLQLIHEVHEFTQYMKSRSTWICTVHEFTQYTNSHSTWIRGIPLLYIFPLKDILTKITL